MRHRLSRVLAALVALAAPAGAASIQFSAPPPSNVPGGIGGTQPLALADLDLDGIVDALVAGPNGITFMRGRGDGGFNAVLPPPFPPLTPDARAVAVGDLNGDHLPDAVVAFGDGSVRFLIGIGGGSFQETASFSNGLIATSVAIANMDFDGHGDVVATYPALGQVVVFQGDGNGSFLSATSVSAPGSFQPSVFALGDLSGDHLVDVLAGGAGGAAYFTNGGGNLFFKTFVDGGTASAVAVADFDATRPGADVLVGTDDGRIDFIGDNGFGLFAAPQLVGSFGGAVTSMDAADFDGDGDIDVAVVNPGSGRFQVMAGHGNGAFDPFAYVAFAGSADFVRVGDLDGDGRPDLVLVDPVSSSLIPLMNITQSQQPLIAQNDNLQTSEDTSGSANVTGNDSGGTGPLFVASVGSAQNGITGVGGDQQSVTYMPNPNFNGGDQFIYTVSDGTHTATATVFVNVAAVNDPPVNTALPAITTTSSKPLTLHAGNGLWTDVDGSVTAFAYQWQRATSPSAPPAIIAGATSATYATTGADSGKILRVVVTASDNGTPLPPASSSAISDWFSATPPGNDDFAKAIALNGTSGTVLGQNVGATAQAGEPNHAGVAAGHSVWWTWKSPSKLGGTLTVDTFGSGIDTVLAVYTGNKVSALSLKGSSDDAFGPQSRVSIPVQANTVYAIAVDGKASATQPTVGALTVNWAYTFP
jgi:hypothetical protein